MSKTNLLIESVHTKIQKSIQSRNVHAVQREINLLGKNVQRSWFNLCTLINNLPILILSILKVFCLIISIILLNLFVTTILTKLSAQLTVGIGGNIMWWHHPYIIPDISDNKNIKIPKIIHQTYKTFDSIPVRWKNGINLWKSYHSEWKYMFWSDSDIDEFMNKYYKWFIPFYYLYPNHIQRVDVARYFILYHYGGIYCDLDISPKRNIESLLSNNIDTFLVETPNLGTTNSLFGSIKQSDFLFYVINNLSEYYNTGYYQFLLPKHMKILFSTGPTAFWSLYGRYYTNNIDRNHKFGILHNKYFGRLPVCFPNPGKSETFDTFNNNDNITISKDIDINIPSHTQSLLGCDMTSFDQSYFYHVEGNSWHNNSSWYINYFLGCQPITTLFMIIMIIWIIYNAIYKHKYIQKKSIKSWFKKHAIIITGSTLLIISMYFWRSVIFYLQKLHCN